MGCDRREGSRVPQTFFCQVRLCKLGKVDLPPQPDDLLAQPTRAQLFVTLSELKRPTSTEELAGLLGLHPNGVRLHLERMAEARLLVRERARHGRGRPRDMWAISADAQPGGDPPSAYADLGRWLARTIQARKTTERAIEDSGREIGRELAPTGEELAAEKKMHAVLVSMGFRPQREVDPTGALTYRLCNCPYRDAAFGNREVVCTLHRGITRGLLDHLSPTTKLTGFVARDPYAAGCLIELRGELADEAIAGGAVAAEASEILDTRVG
jgi:predicted ArsR family transcriptional regulator